MNDNPLQKPRPPALPTSISDWEANRKTRNERTLNDHVEALHLGLLAGASSDDKASQDRATAYNALLDAVYDEDAVEGSLAADNVFAAKMIRDYAAEDDRDPYVKAKKAKTLSNALNIVLRRYGWSRAQRARMVGGEIVPNGE